MYVLYTIFVVYLVAYISFEFKKRSVFFFEMRTILSASVLTMVPAGVFYNRHCLDTNISNQSGSILGHSSLDTPLKLYRNRFFLFMLLRVRNSASGSCIPFRFIPSSEPLSLVDLLVDRISWMPFCSIGSRQTNIRLSLSHSIYYLITLPSTLNSLDPRFVTKKQCPPVFSILN